MKIIGHRGAAGVATENTLPSIRKAVAAKADFVEIDIRKTRDNKIVVSHDDSLLRVFGVRLKISAHTLKELHTVCPELPTLENALTTMKSAGAIIEFKEFIEPNRVMSIINKFNKKNVRFASFNHNLLRAIKKSNPDAFCYVLEHHSPFEIINKARKMHMNGIGLNYGVINPLTYFLARRDKMEIYIYTVNKKWIINVMGFFYPKAYICTDFPGLVKK
ncbi:glycerophosphodiester phosphodiesterase [Candidatus Saccharibacteria bacterium]|nr:glycerophosphodiester phosphodiesterase [Candidatus Saccharibacteria bacterium]